MNVFKETNISHEFKKQIIKKVFTAIGFGAQGSSSPAFWDVDGERTTYAINDLIKNPYDRERFMDHGFVKEFMQEQRDISKIIFAMYRRDYPDVEILHNTSGNVSEAKLLAYLYQHVETELMDDALSHVPKDNLLLRCHDAFYVSHISTDDILEVKFKLQKYLPELSLDKTEINEWVTVDPRFIQTSEDDLAEHRRIMAQEMERAKTYVPKHLDNVIPINTPLTNDALQQKYKDAEIKRLEAQIKEQEAGRLKLEQLLRDRGIKS